MSASTHLFYDHRDPILRLTWHEPPPGADVPEVAVQEIWRSQQLRHASLRTTGGQSVQVLHPGDLNEDGGPDFSNARLRIGDTVWFGDVEIHPTSRGWFDHRHHHDERYNRVVLHVVLQPDLWTGSLVRQDGTALPELVLAPHLDAPFRDRLVRFFSRPTEARPCAWGIGQIPSGVTSDWLRAQAAARLQRRAHAYTRADSSQLLYENVAAAFGYRPNAEPMRLLAQRVSLQDLCTLRSQKDREALLFGMSGLLPSKTSADSIEDAVSRAYVHDLLMRFEVLQPRDASPLDAVAWQYARLRPANFPELRIAQFAGLVRPDGPLAPPRQTHLLTMLLEHTSLSDFDALLVASPGDFWTTHYRLTRPSAYHSTSIGPETRHRLLINVLVPAALAQAPAHQYDEALRRACALYEALPPENDRLVREFAFPSDQPLTHLHTQGLHELDEAYCQPQRCLDCAIGHVLIQGTTTPTSEPTTSLHARPTRPHGISP